MSTSRIYAEASLVAYTHINASFSLVDLTFLRKKTRLEKKSAILYVARTTHKCD